MKGLHFCLYCSLYSLILWVIGFICIYLFVVSTIDVFYFDYSLGFFFLSYVKMECPHLLFGE